MKNRINLFKRKPQQDYLTLNAPKLRNYLTGAGVLLFIFFLVLISQALKLNAEQQDLLKKKETYLKYLLDENDVEANMKYFKSKETQVNTFLKNDANFLPYYEVLKKSLDDTSSNATLDAVDIDNVRKTRFVVKFSDLNGVLAFLRYIEGGNFLKNFISLTLQGFSVNQQQTGGNQYQLELQGVFKELNTK